MSEESFDVYHDGWSLSDHLTARSEGWDIWHCLGSDNGEWQVCKVDEDYTWAGDTDVWAHVYERAARGSVTHQRALNYVRRWNPMEYDSIVKWVDNRITAG